MKLVVDANVVISALIADSKTRELIVTLDPDDILYVACALASDAAIWSDDTDFDEQDVVETYSTTDVIGTFDTR